MSRSRVQVTGTNQQSKQQEEQKAAPSSATWYHSASGILAVIAWFIVLMLLSCYGSLYPLLDQAPFYDPLLAAMLFGAIFSFFYVAGRRVV